MSEARGWKWTDYATFLMPHATHWQPVSKCNRRAVALADRHYSRGKVGSPEIGPPGQKLVLLSRDQQAVWGSHRPAPWTDAKRMDGWEGHSCFIFRNEGQVLSSELIEEAITLTELAWGTASWITYVAVEKIASSNPGYCFLKAGFKRVGYRNDTKHGTMARLERRERP